MAELNDSPEMIARDITLAVIEKRSFAAETIGEAVGKIYKTILKNVREAWQEKYE